MSFAPQGVSPFLPGNNYMNIDHGLKKDVDRSLILRKKNNKVNYKKCSDVELLELLKKNEKLLSNKALVDNLPDKGVKVQQKNKEIREELASRNITIEKKNIDKNDDDKDVRNAKDVKDDIMEDNDKENDTENENKSKNTTEADVEKENQHALEIESINQKLKTMNISDGSDSKDNKDDTKPTTRVKRGQARVEEKILKDSTLKKPTYMVRHTYKPDHKQSAIIPIKEALDIQIRQRKIQKEIEINEAKKRLERTVMSTGPVNYHSNDYRNTNNEYDDDIDDDNDDDSDDSENHSYYESSGDEEADAFLFQRRE